VHACASVLAGIGVRRFFVVAIRGGGTPWLRDRKLHCVERNQQQRTDRDG
jgi:hypothetical protein